MEEVAIIPSKRLRNKIVGFSTHLIKRIQKEPVRGISLKLQEEERERRMDFVPDESAIKTDRIEFPWSRLGQDPVLVSLDHIFLLAEPATMIEGSSEDSVQEVKKSRIRELEKKLLRESTQLNSEMICPELHI